ncbi:MAG: acetylglutamate kinase, partial [Pedobacter sp.]
MNKETLTVIKIGGNIIDNSEKLHSFLLDFSSLSGKKILVHGGGKAATDMSISMDVVPKMLEGRRITDIETLRIVTMVYAGLINKNMVAQLQAKKCNAIGLTGADGNLIKGVKRPVKMVKLADGTERSVDYGFVGDLDNNSVNPENLEKLLKAGFVPVFCAITHDGDTQLLNTNADTVAAALAVAMSSLYRTSLVYCFEKKGVMLDVDDEDSLIASINNIEFNNLTKEGVISEGMIPKLQ